jgi:4-nitrophenyl phosphatase
VVDAPRWPPAASGTWVIDLDGVVWLTGVPIDGAAGAVARLRATGNRVLFVTNNSSPTVPELQARLGRCGIDTEPRDVVSSAEAAASMVSPGERVLVLADEGVDAALAARGAHPVADPPYDAVVVGWTHGFDFARLATAASAARDGARLIGTNEDATHPTPDGLLPGAGALLAAVSVAAGKAPEVAGKPHAPMVGCIAARAGDVVCVVGDRGATDGELAARLGVPFALVLSGVSGPGEAADGGPPRAVVAPTLGRLVTDLFPS